MVVTHVTAQTAPLPRSPLGPSSARIPARARSYTVDTFTCTLIGAALVCVFLPLPLGPSRDIEPSPRASLGSSGRTTSFTAWHGECAGALVCPRHD